MGKIMKKKKESFKVMIMKVLSSNYLTEYFYLYCFFYPAVTIFPILFFMLGSYAPLRLCV